jgi:hypothetical protein
MMFPRAGPALVALECRDDKFALFATFDRGAGRLSDEQLQAETP